MPRIWVWIQLIIGWLPIGALFSVLIMAAHGIPAGPAIAVALRMVACAAALGLAVHALTGRMPWPHPFRLRFVAAHMLAAAIYALLWLLANSVIESLLHGVPVIVIGPGLLPYLVTGVWLYVMVAGVAYASRAAVRSSELVALEARSQLAALRAQLHPHFLFNALHTVVQLIPLDPRAAVRAAEQLADALRTAIEEQRDLLPLADEWAFVQRYLAIESIRFGERLRVRSEIAAGAMRSTLPSFALQTLVENAVRHAAAPRIEATEVCIAADLVDDVLTLRVSDNGVGADLGQIAHSQGTGLRRLRERLGWLYGGSARLDLISTPLHGFSATLTLPQSRSSADDHHLNPADD